MKKKVLYINPFQFVKKKLSSEILPWSIYLDNFIKSKVNNIVSDLIYLPAETNFEPKFDGPLRREDINTLYSILDESISQLDFTPENSYICIGSPTSFDYQAVKLIAEYFQSFFPTAIVVVGGYHATSCPDDFICPNSPVDYINIGEGELNLHFIVNNGFKKQETPIVLKNNPIGNLDDLPSLDFSILDKYINMLRDKARGLSISLSRSCPSQCNFCIEKKLVNRGIKRWRAYSPKRAVQEVNTMVNYGIEHGFQGVFGFYDCVFGYNIDWLKQFLKKYKVNEQIINHFLETRVDILNKKVLRLLKKKKMFLFYGVESFSKKMLRIMNKTYDPVGYLRAVNKIFKIHKKLRYDYTIGILCNHPGESRESYQETFANLNRIAKNEEANISPTLYHLFPKTANYDNLRLLNKNYGTIAYFKEWWKNMSTLKMGAFAIKPSRELSLIDSIEIFTDNHIKLDKLKYRNKEWGYLPLLQAIKIIKKQKKELIEFLEKHNFLKIATPKVPLPRLTTTIGDY